MEVNVNQSTIQVVLEGNSEGSKGLYEDLNRTVRQCAAGINKVGGPDR